MTHFEHVKRLLPLYNYNLKSPHTKMIIAVSHQVRMDLIEFLGLEPEKITVIPNGVELDEYHPRVREQRREDMLVNLGVNPDDFLILFVGDDLDCKGLIRALRALELIRESNAVLMVVGGFPEQLVHYRDYASSRKLNARVIFAGTQYDMEPIYARADALVLPTFYDSFGLVLLEAMAFGIPVVSSPGAGFAKDAIADRKNGFIGESPEQIAAVVEELINDVGLRSEVGRNARSTAEKYSWDQVAGRTLEVYEKVVNDNG
ncbi:MAG: glycosyltransferase family 4 protein [Deltaproteobacteria bacterium]|nr:glycosyltransferase family 4 protein [Deltaproteobacteria bacterium]